MVSSSDTTNLHNKQAKGAKTKEEEEKENNQQYQLSSLPRYVLLRCVEGYVLGGRMWEVCDGTSANENKTSSMA